jgi:phospholipid transport system substrate-binding protein
MNRTLLIALAAAVPVVAAPPAFAADPAQGTVDALHAGLLTVMKSGGTQASRARAIAPVVDRTFDLPLMTRLSVGPSWTTIPAAHLAALVQAFR